MAAVEELPSIESLIARSRALALVDSILMPDWEHRYFSFNKNWGEGEMLASMRNGSGSEYFILFTSSGAVGKLLDNESEAGSATELISSVPFAFSGFKLEPAFRLDSATFFFWRQLQASMWASNPPSSASQMLDFLVRDFAYYCEWATRYYEVSVDRAVVKRVFENSAVLSADLVHSLRSDRDHSDVFEDNEEIGY